MSKVKVVLNKAGVRELLQSSEMEAICLEKANEVKNRVGSDGYEVNSYKGKNRVNASVKATTYKTRKDNYENHTLLKAVSK